MPAKQAISAAIEFAMNSALSLAINGDELIEPLAGRCCTIHIQELALSFSLYFSSSREQNASNNQVHQYLDVCVDDDWSEEQKQSIDERHCYVSVSVEALPELKKTSQLTRLIKQGKLDFYGDLYLLQKLSALFAELDIDLEDIVSKYIGDVPAHQLFSLAKAMKEKIREQHALCMRTLSDACLEEKPVAVRPIMLHNFIDQVKVLQSDVERMKARIEKLERDRA
ncbi:ubiquinone biosynthesis accessory factor UbiJ [Agaribacter flavus]|uniref:Ubiquinone biosynthesis accessory factor UbiJ n=1 Tax=Agaribacter flavus TaxID=1902781 RepID=A0ABV7FT25_9ALTE